MPTTLPFAHSPYTLRALELADEAAVQLLFDRSRDYFASMTGNGPGPGAAREFLLESSQRFGLWHPASGLIGVVGYLAETPAAREGQISLLLIDPAFRSQGLGARLVEAVSLWAALSGCCALWLVLGEHNQRALRFWAKQGFHVALRHSAALMGPRIYACVVMGVQPGGMTAPQALHQAHWQRFFAAGTIFGRVQPGGAGALPREARLAAC